MHSRDKLFLILTFLATPFASYGTNKTALYIGGFFPLENNNWDASGLIPAAEMAIDDINNSTNILAGYELKMEWNNTECDTGVGMARLFDQIHSLPRKIMLLGAGCTLVTGPMAETAQYWNLVQVSHTSSSPSLNDRAKYPFLFRLYPSEDSMNFPRLALMDRFGWEKAALLYSTEGSFSVIIQQMRDLLLANSKVPLLMESFSDDPTSALENIKVKESRIIIANMFESTARKAFCKAHELGITGAGYVWIIPGWFTDQWWLEQDTTCTPEQMTSAVDGYIAMEALAVDTGTVVTDGGRTPAEFLEEYNRRVLLTTYDRHDWAPFAYDSVYTIAVALNNSIQELAAMGLALEDFDYNRRDMVQIFFDRVNNSDVSGITGPIRFDISGKRLGYTKIEQLQGGREKQIAIFDDSAREFVSINLSQFVWSTSNGAPPIDGPVESEQWKTVSLPLFLTMTTIASGGILFVLFLLIINIRYRDRKIMRLSSPNLNYVICIGGFFMYDYVILLGLDSTTLKQQEKPSAVFSALCVIKQWLLPVAFSLSFGATFAKAWRIHRIFANSKMKKRTIRDSQLLLIVGVLLVLDAILLITWDIVDKPHGTTTSLPKQTINRDKIILPRIEQCHCDKENVWVGVFLGYKGLLLLYGAFLAWENRVVKIDVLSDARNIAITIYTTVVLCCIVVPVTLVFTQEIEFAYAILAGSINFATTVLLALCFLPKIHIVFTNSVSTENILIASLMTMSQRNGEARTEDRLIGDLKQKIKELETTITNLKLAQTKEATKAANGITRDRSSCSLVKFSRSAENIEMKSSHRSSSGERNNENQRNLSREEGSSANSDAKLSATRKPQQTGEGTVDVPRGKRTVDMLTGEEISDMPQVESSDL